MGIERMYHEGPGSESGASPDGRVLERFLKTVKVGRGNHLDGLEYERGVEDDWVPVGYSQEGDVVVKKAERGGTSTKNISREEFDALNPGVREEYDARWEAVSEAARDTERDRKMKVEVEKIQAADESEEGGMFGWAKSLLKK